MPTYIPGVTCGLQVHVYVLVNCFISVAGCNTYIDQYMGSFLRKNLAHIFYNF